MWLDSERTHTHTHTHLYTKSLEHTLPVKYCKRPGVRLHTKQIQTNTISVFKIQYINDTPLFIYNVCLVRVLWCVECTLASAAGSVEGYQCLPLGSQAGRGARGWSSVRLVVQAPLVVHYCCHPPRCNSTPQPINKPHTTHPPLTTHTNNHTHMHTQNQCL